MSDRKTSPLPRATASVAHHVEAARGVEGIMEETMMMCRTCGKQQALEFGVYAGLCRPCAAASKPQPTAAPGRVRAIPSDQPGTTIAERRRRQAGGPIYMDGGRTQLWDEE